MAVEPVGARLLDWEFVGEGFTRFDTWEADSGHAVLIKRKDQTMPVNGRHLIQVVGHVDLDVFAFLEAHHWPGGFPVVSNAFLHEITGVNFNAVDRQIVFTGHNHGWDQQAQKSCKKTCFHLFSPNFYTSLKQGREMCLSPALADLSQASYSKLISPYIPA